MRRAFVAGIIGLMLMGSSVFGADLLVMDWNLLNFDDDDPRVADFRTVVQSVQPDLLVTQEVNGYAGMLYFRQEVLDEIAPGEYTSAPFHSGPDTDNALYIRNGCVSVIDSSWLGTSVRDIDWWDLRAASGGQEFRLYSVHLKAGSDEDDQEIRDGEAAILRTHLDHRPAGLPVLVAGDYNLYNSSEPAYQRLLASGPGRLIDPLDQPGVWHNSYPLRTIHTQSSRELAFGGGASGGMDDRFDFILISPDLQDGQGIELPEGEYLAYGNDGQHYNQAVNGGGSNDAVPMSVADALHDSSDHLPVVALLSLGGSVPTPTPTGTPSPTPVPSISYCLDLEEPVLYPGLQFCLTRSCANHTTETAQLDEYVVLDVHGRYWFWPGWTSQVDSRWLTLTPGSDSEQTLLEFTWPAGAGEGQGLRFWGALTEHSTLTLVVLDSIEWSYQEWPG